GMFYGLLRSRDLSPFGGLRLDMRPAHAVSIEPGSWVVETELGYQNTWALSPEVEKYLISQEPNGRHRLGPADMQAIVDLPGENYLLDLEVGLSTWPCITRWRTTGRCTESSARSRTRMGSSTVPSRSFTTRSVSVPSAGRRWRVTRQRSSMTSRASRQRSTKSRRMAD